MEATRKVERLRLRAARRDELRPAAAAIEDALRTASLPAADTGALILIRRLDLGRVPRGASPQTLALRLEAASGAFVPVRLRPGDPEQPEAPAVRFADRIEALSSLLVELARGGGSAWYWAHLLSAAGVAAADRAGSKSSFPALRATLPAALTAAMATPAGIAGVSRMLELVAAHGAAPAVLDALPATPASLPAFGPIVRPSAQDPIPTYPTAGLADRRVPSPAPAHSRTWRAAHTRSPGAGVLCVNPAPAPASRPPEPSPGWRALLAAARARFTVDDPRRLWLEALAAWNTGEPAAAERSQKRPSAGMVGEDPESGQPPPAGRTSSTRPSPETAELPEPRVDPREPGEDALPASHHAGLFLLVQAMARLRIEELATNRFPLPLLLMHELCARLRVDLDDAARRALPELVTEPGRAPRHWLAPAVWRSLAARAEVPAPVFARRRMADRQLLTDRSGRLVLGVTNEGARPPAWVQQGGVAPARRPPLSPIAPHLLLLAACQFALARFLRRHADTSLRRLIRRPGRVIASSTHIDLLFTHEQAELGPRRAGLDIDPGWVPWLSRVVAFHYLDPDELSR